MYLCICTCIYKYIYTKINDKIYVIVMLKKTNENAVYVGNY